MSEIQQNGGTLLTVAGSILGGIASTLKSSLLLQIQLQKDPHISLSEVIRIAEGAFIGALVGGIVGYFLKLFLDKIFKKSPSS